MTRDSITQHSTVSVQGAYRVQNLPSRCSGRWRFHVVGNPIVICRFLRIDLTGRSTKRPLRVGYESSFEPLNIPERGGQGRCRIGNRRARRRDACRGFAT